MLHIDKHKYNYFCMNCRHWSQGSGITRGEGGEHSPWVLTEGAPGPLPLLPQAWPQQGKLCAAPPAHRSWAGQCCTNHLLHLRDQAGQAEWCSPYLLEPLLDETQLCSQEAHGAVGSTLPPGCPRHSTSILHFFGCLVSHRLSAWIAHI